MKFQNSDVVGLEFGASPLLLSTPDNDNWPLLPDWMTTAEFLQWIHNRKERMRRELAADFRLRNCPEHRLRWEIAIAMERCGRWHLLGEREG